MDDDARRNLNAIIDQISPDDREMIADFPLEQLILLHHGLGRSIRNSIRRNEVTPLVRWSISQTNGFMSLDDLSYLIIIEIAESLRATLRPAGKS